MQSENEPLESVVIKPESTKAKSTRYQPDEEEEVDQTELQLRSDDVIHPTTEADLPLTESEFLPTNSFEKAEQPIISLDEDETQTVSTAVTLSQSAPKGSLFEQLLSFLDTKETLNPVLAGYFSKLFSMLLQNKQREVLSYVYDHLTVLDNFLTHLY